MVKLILTVKYCSILDPRLKIQWHFNKLPTDNEKIYIKQDKESLTDAGTKKQEQ